MGRLGQKRICSKDGENLARPRGHALLLPKKSASSSASPGDNRNRHGMSDRAHSKAPDSHGLCQIISNFAYFGAIWKNFSTDCGTGNFLRFFHEADILQKSNAF